MLRSTSFKRKKRRLVRLKKLLLSKLDSLLRNARRKKKIARPENSKTKKPPNKNKLRSKRS